MGGAAAILGGKGYYPSPELPGEPPLSGEGGEGAARLIPTHEWHLVEEGYFRHETCLMGLFKRQNVSILCGRSRVCAGARGSKYLAQR